MKKNNIIRWFSMLLLFLAAGMTSAFGQSLTISDFDIELGETQDVTISVVADEGQSVYGVQTDVMLSEGLSLESAAAIGEGLMLTKNEQEGGAIRIGLLSLSGNSIPAGEAIKLTIKADAGLQEGTVTLSNSRLTISTSGTEVKVKDAIANVTPAKPGLTLSDFTVTAGSTAKATIRLTRSGLTVYGVQTDIMLPDGLTVTNVSAPNGYVSKNTLADGAVRVALLMLDGTTLSSGDIITLTIKAEADAESGEVSLSNSRLTTSTSGTEQKVEDTQAQATVEESDEADIIVNATPGDLTAAINEAVEGKTVKSLTVNLLDAGTYTVSGTISTPGDFALNGTDGAVIDATQLSDALITLDGTNAMAVKEDGTESDHKLISTVMINDVTITGLQSSLIKDAQKTLLEEFIIDNSVIEVPASNKSVVDFNGKGYVGKVVVSNSTIWAKDKHTGFFAQYGSRPKNVNGNWLQEFNFENSTIVNIANGKNFCDLKQNGTAQNVYTIKDNIFVDCGKQNQVVVGFNKGQASASPVWLVDGNYFSWGGEVVNAAEIEKAGKKNDEDIVKNCVDGMHKFADAANGDFTLSSGCAQNVAAIGDPRWLVEPSEWIDIKADFTDQSFFTAADANGATAGLKMNADGTFTRVAADDPKANAVISGKYHSDDHGISNFSATVPVEGPVKISFGTCAWGGDVIVKDATGAQVVKTFNTNTGACYHQDKENNIVSAYYKGDATTLTISGGAYVPYFAVEAVDPSEIPSTVTVTFDISGTDAIGVAPESITVDAGETITIPANFTLYKEDFTLTAWADTKEHAIGSEMTVDNDVTLTPVFTLNDVKLADRTEPVTVKWMFRRDAGAPTVAWEGKDGLVWVAQGTVNGKSIDIAAKLSTSPGKFANGNWTDWAQVNNGTTFTIPSCKGAVVSMEAYSPITTTTIDGQSDYEQGQTISYEIANPAEEIDVVIGDGSYYRYIQAVLPVVEGQGGASFDNAEANIIWDLTDVNEYATPNVVNPAEAFTLTTVNVNDFTVHGVAAPSAGINKGVRMLQLAPADGGNNTIEFIAKPTKGLTFTARTVYGKICRYGTDGGTLTIVARTAEGNEETLATGLHPARNNKEQADDAHGADEGYAAEFEFELPRGFATQEGFTLSVIVEGLATNKQWGIGDVRFTGTVDGTTANVTKYTFAAKAEPAEGGSVNIYPNGEEFDEGTELKLTATKNFGYQFVNWTDAEGNVVSEDNVFNYTVNADAELTANFEAIDTYELKIDVDGTNEYMVEINPKPTVVDGKNMYEIGTTVTLTATQYDGLVTFNNWSDDDTNSEKTITMVEDTELTATYSEADIIAGWDFYRPGNSGRKADFASEDNDADALNLVNTQSGEVGSWLDKSYEGAGGYESFKGAAVNWRTGDRDGDVGNWHWQTKVNAAAFTDINVQFQMLYNYNAYQTYKAEWSTDGDSWTTFGTITMNGTKSPATFSETLPAEANNQANLYIRMIADKESNVDGSASKNDGNSLAMFFITGTPKLVDDGKAPKLMSTVPADGATGASASGKIVLTFDERVKVADGTKAMMAVANGASGAWLVEPTVSGKTISFEYKSLEYNTPYTFTLASNTVADLTDNYLAEAITIGFTTMARPTVEKKLYDFVVPDDGTFKEALIAAAARTDNSQRYRIFIRKGDYVIPANKQIMVTGTDGKQYADPKTSFGSPNVSIIGEDMEETTVTNEMPNSLAENPTAGAGGMANPLEGIRESGVLYMTSGAQNTYFQDIKLWNATADATGRNVVLVDGGNKTIYKNVCLWAYQDTYVSDNERSFYYFEGGLLRGRTDFLCGGGDQFYNGVTLQMCETGGYISCPRNNVKYGHVFKDCTIKGEKANVDGSYYLGRPWTGGAESYWINTKMEAVPKGEGWAEMSGNSCTRFAEYNSTTATGSVIDLSARKTVIGGQPNNPILTADEAQEIGNLHNMFGDWDPTLATEQAPQVTNLELNGDNLTWEGSDYALLYAVCYEGNVVAFTLDESIDVTTLDLPAAVRGQAPQASQFSVRAANEMGGLNEAVVATDGTSTAIRELAPITVDGPAYNTAGQRVSNSYRGIVVKNGRKAVVK